MLLMALCLLAAPALAARMDSLACDEGFQSAMMCSAQVLETMRTWAGENHAPPAWAFRVDTADLLSNLKGMRDKDLSDASAAGTVP